MLANQIEHIDFFKHDKKSSHIKKNMVKILSAFFAVQILFLVINIEKAQVFLKEKEQQSEETYANYAKLKEATKNGNQNEIILHFSKLHNNGNVVGNILSSSFIRDRLDETSSNIDNKTTQNFKEQYKNVIPQINTETKTTIYHIYKINPYYGLESQKKSIDSMNCFMLDMMCHIVQSSIKNLINNDYNRMKNKIDKINYDIKDLKINRL